MNVETVRDFYDTKERTFRKAGDRFEVTEERLAAINGTKYGQLVREVEAKPEAKPRRTRAKKAEE